MKKDFCRMLLPLLITCLLIALTPLECLAASIDFSSYAKDELIDLRKQIDDAIEILDTKEEERYAEDRFKKLEKSYGFTPIEHFSKGEHVDNVIARLIDLGYLKEHKRDYFDDNASDAVYQFQIASGKFATGDVSYSTYNDLMDYNAVRFSESNPVYKKFSYDSIARYPSVYEGEYIQYRGRVAQVLEGEGFVVVLIATDGKYGDYVYTQYTPNPSQGRALVDDYYIVKGVCYGIYTYETTSGIKATVPSCVANSLQWYPSPD